MAKHRKRPDEPGINMTPMIDVVFQLIIFFVITVDMQNERLEEILRLAMAPHAEPVQVKDPREINIDVDRRGRVMISRTLLRHDQLRAILSKSVADFGQRFPVVIRADGEVTHDHVRQVMDVCTEAGLWQIRFGAIRERAQQVE